MKQKAANFYISTFGCKVNQYESQLLEDEYSAGGMRRVTSPEEASLIIINSCTVTAEADRQCRQLIRRLRARNPEAEIIVTGCYAKRAAEEIAAAAEKIKVKQRESAFGSIASFRGHSRAFIKIQDGCDAHCTYCIVPSVRPVMWSKPYEQAAMEIQSLAAAGYPEAVLTGIHLGRYEGGISALMRRLLSIEGTFRFRLSSLEISEVDDLLIGLIRDNPGRICPHLHVPLQSGSDTVLSRMNRPYRKDIFRARLEKIRAAVPDIALTTDIITGFPGETERDAEETFEFVRGAAFSRLHVFPFSPRTGTPAAKMPGQVSGDEMKRRSRRLIELGNALKESYESRFSGTVREAVVEKENGKTTFLTDNYITVNSEDTPILNRSLVKIKIVERIVRKGVYARFGEPIRQN